MTTVTGRTIRRANYDLDEDQSALQEVFARFLAQHCPPAVVRSAEPTGFDAELWNGLVELGAPVLAIPEALGGGGGTLCSLVVVAEQLGRVLAPVPLIETAVVARLLSTCHTGPARGALDELVAGAIGTPLLEPLSTGQQQLTPAGAVATLAVGMNGPTLVLGRRTQPAAAVPNLGAMPIGWWSLSEPDVSTATLLSGHEAACGLEILRGEWQLLTAAALVGLAQESLDVAVSYARERRAFGVPIGTFQALAHPLADAQIAIVGGRRLARKAAWFADQGLPEAPALQTMAFLQARRAAAHTTAVAVHVHGGVGITDEADITLHYRRAKAWAAVASDPARELLRLGHRLFRSEA